MCELEGPCSGGGDDVLQFQTIDFKLPCYSKPKRETKKANKAVASPSGDIRVRPYSERTYSVC